MVRAEDCRDLIGAVGVPLLQVTRMYFNVRLNTGCCDCGYIRFAKADCQDYEVLSLKCDTSICDGLLK